MRNNIAPGLDLIELITGTLSITAIVIAIAGGDVGRVGQSNSGTKTNADVAVSCRHLLWRLGVAFLLLSRSNCLPFSSSPSQQSPNFTR